MNKYWLRSGSINFLQSITTLILAFGSYFMLVRVIPKGEFGIWVLFLTTTSIIEVARISLIQNGLVKHLSSNDDGNRRNINTASLVLNILFTILIIACLFGVSGLLSELLNSPQLRFMLYAYCITSVILIPYAQFSYILQANLNFKGLFISTTSRNLLFFIFSVLIYNQLISSSLFLLVVFHGLSAMIGSITGYYVSKRHLTFSSHIDWQWVLKLYKYGKYTIGTGIGSILNSSVDQLMLGSIISTSSVAIYNASLRVPNLINIPANVIATIVFPKSSKFNKDESVDIIRNFYEKFVGVNLAIIIPMVIFVFIFPTFVITFIAGQNYIDSVPLLKVMILYTLFVPFGRQFGTTFDSVGYPNINFYVTILNALINIVLNYFLIKSLGIMGAVYGTLISYILSLIIIHTILYKLFQVRPLMFVKHIVLTYSQGVKFLQSRL